MNINLKLSGVAEAVIQEMIESGYATSKTEAIRMALVSFKNKFLDKSELETELVIRKIQSRDKEISEGNGKWVGREEALGEYAKYLE